MLLRLPLATTKGHTLGEEFEDINFQIPSRSNSTSLKVKQKYIMSNLNIDMKRYVIVIAFRFKNTR